MTLLRVADVSLAFGARILFDKISLVVEEGERVGLVGVNGSGKSTLMKIIAGAQKADSALIQVQRGTRIEYLPQEPTFPDNATVESELTVAQSKLVHALAEHKALSDALHDASDEKTLKRLGELAEHIEHLGGWDTAFLAKRLLDKLGVKEWDAPISTLSGGLKKRVAIARALLAQPDLLLLDEPTNHLDADTVDWLEEALDAFEGALLLVTHDRSFLDGLVERMVEITPPGSAGGGGLTSYPGNYETFLEQKFAAEELASVSEHKRSRWIAQEVAWLRRGPQARRTKSKARIERARQLLSEKGFQRPKVPTLQMSTVPRLSQTVIHAEKVAQGYGDTSIFSDVSLIVQPGERIGIVGRNGAGKTTLLRTLLGELPPTQGTVKLGPKTKIAYFDQQRMQLDENMTVAEAAWHDDWVELSGNKVRLSDYLEDLLFPVPVQRMKVSALSGGERNRLLLARLFLLGANVLVLDEPTNDLDLVTMNVLERLLLEFQGAALIVAHDRYFLNKVATSILALNGDGAVTRYEGNWDMYVKLRPKQTATQSATSRIKSMTVSETPAVAAKSNKGGRLSYKDQRDFDGIEAAIAKAEGKKGALETQLQDPALFAKDKELLRLSAELEAATKEVDRLYRRWEELNALLEG
jgi:ABC transport system ATP-binding/permease protein